MPNPVREVAFKNLASWLSMKVMTIAKVLSIHRILYKN